MYLIPNLKHNVIIGINTLKQLGYCLVSVDEFNDIDPLLKHKVDLSHFALPEDNVFYNKIDYGSQLNWITNYSKVKSQEIINKTHIGTCSTKLQDFIKHLIHDNQKHSLKLMLVVSHMLNLIYVLKQVQNLLRYQNHII